MKKTQEHKRLEKHRHRQANWKLWGPYLSERAWGTVREDYSADGNAWDYFPEDHARSRAYRWNEDGLAGISDRNQFLCFSVALWNENDPVLKERIFGLNQEEGNHGEDVKDYYYFLDNTPTHSYMKMLYKYPHGEFPYKEIREQNKKAGFFEPEYELMDTGILDEGRYFDLFVEYAKGDQEDILIKITACNRGKEEKKCHILPTLWFRNTWSWGVRTGPNIAVPARPVMREKHGETIMVEHPVLGPYNLYMDPPQEILFTENETNNERIFQKKSESPYVKDAFHRYLIEGEKDAVNPEKFGTKAAAHYNISIPAGEQATLTLRLCKGELEDPFDDFEETFSQAKKEADEFYEAIQNPKLSPDLKKIQRQALAGMLWSKQLYYYEVKEWLEGDSNFPAPPKERLKGRNHDWDNIANFDVISMPDTWEYPWYASWDLAFHCIPLNLIDPDFAKRQMILMVREWYMHPNGQFPAYEWAFGDTNPPVHAWASWRVFKIDEKMQGKGDLEFLKTIFHKQLINFTWWVNKKDEDGRNIFQGGFLGLDNISIFDRSATLPTGGHLDQSDATSWMGFYCLTMIKIALELSKTDPVYQDSAAKFFEHFLRISHAMNHCGGEERSVWDEEDGFFYDHLHLTNGEFIPLKIRSLVGLMPILAVETLEPHLLENMTVFRRRMHWFLSKYPELVDKIADVQEEGKEKRRLLSVLTSDKLKSLLKYMLDEDEFLSDYGIRSVSKYHEEHPFSLKEHGVEYSINYEPAESQNSLFGGNSNWRGPIWLPLNFLLIESLQKFHHYYGDSFKVQFPTGSGNELNLWDVAAELSKRLMCLFKENKEGKRPIYGNQPLYNEDPHFQDLVQFNEYFHGDLGWGLGANHQTGWTGLIAKLIQQSGEELQ